MTDEVYRGTLEAAERIHCSQSQVKKLCRKGEMKDAIKSSGDRGKWLIPQSAIDSYINKQKGVVKQSEDAESDLMAEVLEQSESPTFQSQEYSARARTHDEGVFKESDAIFDERRIRQITNILEVGTMPNDEIFYGMAKYIDYFSLVSNRYLNSELHETCNQVIGKLTETVEFVARNSDGRRMHPEDVHYGEEHSTEGKLATQKCLQVARILAEELRKVYSEYIDKVMSIITPSSVLFTKDSQMPENETSEIEVNDKHKRMIAHDQRVFQESDGIIDEANIKIVLDRLDSYVGYYSSDKRKLTFYEQFFKAVSNQYVVPEIAEACKSMLEELRTLLDHLSMTFEVRGPCQGPDGDDRWLQFNENPPRFFVDDTYYLPHEMTRKLRLEIEHLWYTYRDYRAVIRDTLFL